MARSRPRRGRSCGRWQLIPPGEGAVHIVGTRASQHGWPAGAGAARNTGIRESTADWLLFLDDDTAPQPDILYRYADAAAYWLQSPQQTTDVHIFGFCGTTTFHTPPSSIWAVAARYMGMFGAFEVARREEFPPWAPTANLLLRRTSGMGSAATLSHAGAPTMDLSGTEDGAADDEVALGDGDERAALMQGRPGAAATPAPMGACAPGRRLLPWCHFDE